MCFDREDLETQATYEDIDDLQKSQEAQNHQTLRFQHLYHQNIYHVSKSYNISVITGYQPNERGEFNLCIRFQDNGKGNVISMTLYQYVRLMKDLRNALFTDEEVEHMDKIDAKIPFKFHEINVPPVLIEVYSGVHVPNIFQLNLRNNKSDPYSRIRIHRETLIKIIHMEHELINTIQNINPLAFTYAFLDLIKQFLDHMEKKKKTSSLEGYKICEQLKKYNKTPNQSEFFLKFSPLLCTLIDRKIRETK